MAPKKTTVKRGRADKEVVTSSESNTASRPRNDCVASLGCSALPYPISAFLRFNSIEDWIDNYPLKQLSNTLVVSNNLGRLVGFTMATFTPKKFADTVVWTTLPGWSPLTSGENGNITSIQHDGTGFKIDPALLFFLQTRLAANLGTMIDIGDPDRMFLPSIVVESKHVYAGNRQTTFSHLSQEKSQIVDDIMFIIQTRSNAANARTIVQLAQSTVTLATHERTGELNSLVTLLERKNDEDFPVELTNFLDSLDTQDSVRAPLIAALISFEMSRMPNAEKLSLLIKVRAKLSKRSLTQFATNLSVHLPVRKEAMNSYTRKDQVEVTTKSVHELTGEDLVILGSQVSTGHAVYEFLSSPATHVFCAESSDMMLYQKKRSSSVPEIGMGTLEDVNLSTVTGQIVKQLCTIPTIPTVQVAPRAPAAAIVTDPF